MNDTLHFASIVEVFPMRLGGEILVDVTIEPEDKDRFPEPKPGDRLAFERGGRQVELEIWAAPRIAQPKGSVRFNVQFRKEDAGDELPEEGARAELRPSP
jgi:hypothetical protein